MNFAMEEHLINYFKKKDLSHKRNVFFTYDKSSRLLRSYLETT